MKKIVFIINSISNPRCIKRVNEFVDNGYNVVIYAFSRNESMHNQLKVDIKIVDSFSNDLSYSKRLPKLFRSIKKVVLTHRKDNVLYYLFALDVAMIFRICCRTSYIYEESDLQHTYISNTYVRNGMEWIDKQIIKKSLLSVFTSDGFIRYHFRDKRPENVYLIENKLDQNVQKLHFCNKHKFDKNNLSIGFVGSPRYESLYSFIDIFCKNFPSYTFHIYGAPVNEKLKTYTKYNNCVLHGYFRTPDDLPSIYSNIDLVVSTYDTKYDNVRYAEPNKLYEAIYFETPIIVSSNTFLAEKVNNLGIGYDLDPFNESQIINLIDSLSCDNYLSKIECIKKIPKESVININAAFFKKLNSLGI